MRSLAKTMFALLILMAGSPGMLGQNILLVHDIPLLLAHSADIRGEILLSAEPLAGSYQFYMEEKVPLEDWMIEQHVWKDASSTLLASAVQTEREPEMMTEDWMIQPFSAGSREIWDFLAESIEEPLKVQEWMICCEDWNLQATVLKIPEVTMQ
jgi:hypothetical protein